MRTCKHHTAGKVRHLARLTRHLRRNFATLGRFSFKGQGFKVSPHLLQVIFQVVAGCMTRLRNARAPAHTPSSCPRPLPAHCHWHDSELTHVGASLIGARFYFLQKVMKRARGRPALRQRRGWPRAAAGKLQWPRIPQVRSLQRANDTRPSRQPVAPPVASLALARGHNRKCLGPPSRLSGGWPPRAAPRPQAKFSLETAHRGRFRSCQRARTGTASCALSVLSIALLCLSACIVSSPTRARVALRTCR